MPESCEELVQRALAAAGAAVPAMHGVFREWGADALRVTRASLAAPAGSDRRLVLRQTAVGIGLSMHAALTHPESDASPDDRTKGLVLCEAIAAASMLAYGLDDAAKRTALNALAMSAQLEKT